MPSLKVMAFGGMIPVEDERLLPDSNAADAANIWLYSGDLQGMRTPVAVHDLVNSAAKLVFRIPKGDPSVRWMRDSYWLEFENINTTVVKSPVAGSEDPTYYWADGALPPGYTSKVRLAASASPLLLGIPRPGVAPGVAPTGGVSTISSTRAYVYTWVSSYGEEGPPSDPTTVTGKIDDTWDISVTAPTAGDTTDRDLAYTNIYRTVTNDQNVAEYRFVTQLAIATLVYADTQGDDIVAGAEPMLSANWSAPPTDLEGICPMANGMLVGWRKNEIWFSEPFRPHAWPAAYVQVIEYNIVGMAAIGQTVVAGTEAYPYFGTGVNPLSITMQRLPAAEPATSRGSFVATPKGVFYASPNGLILVVPGLAQNVTLPTISVDKWATLLNLPYLRAAVINEAYYAFSGVQQGVFEETTFDEDAFQQEDFTGTRDGMMIDFNDRRVGATRLTSEEPTYNVIQDPWTGAVMMIRGGQVIYLDLTSAAPQGRYLWRSKVFTTGKPQNFGAFKVTWYPPRDDTVASLIKFYCDGVLRHSTVIDAQQRQVNRLPSGFRGTEWQFQIEGTLQVKSVELATTVEELQSV